MIVLNQKDVDNFYFYKDKKRSPRPEKFPCVVLGREEGGGLSGEYYSYKVVYCPDGLDFESWAAGVEEGMNYGY
jgi:hypothetical protein